LRPEQVVTRSALLENVWGMQFDPGSNLVDVHMARLRRKLQERARTPVLRTVRGKGFQLTEHAEAGADASVDENADANAGRASPRCIRHDRCTPRSRGCRRGTSSQRKVHGTVSLRRASCRARCRAGMSRGGARGTAPLV